MTAVWRWVARKDGETVATGDSAKDVLQAVCDKGLRGTVTIMERVADGSYRNHALVDAEVPSAIEASLRRDLGRAFDKLQAVGPALHLEEVRWSPLTLALRKAVRVFGGDR